MSEPRWKTAEERLRDQLAEMTAERDRFREALKRIRDKDGITNHNGEWISGLLGVIARRALSSPLPPPEGGKP
jgi:hypothetical protein